MFGNSSKAVNVMSILVKYLHYLPASAVWPRPSSDAIRISLSTDCSNLCHFPLLLAPCSLAARRQVGRCRRRMHALGMGRRGRNGARRGGEVQAKAKGEGNDAFGEIIYNSKCKM